MPCFSCLDTCYLLVQGIGQPLSNLPVHSFGSTNSTSTSLSLPKDQVFDTLAPIDVEKLNAAFINRHQAALLGSHLRA